MDENSVSLPRPKFDIKGTNKDRIYCQIRLVGCLENMKLDLVWKKIQMM